MHTVKVMGCPVAPSKIVCIGRNYAAHIAELGNELPTDMVVFIKPNSAVGNTLRADCDGETLHYEGEMAFSIMQGRPAAVAFGLDLTRRELQGKLKSAGLPWERAKAFDGAALFSDFVALPEAALEDGLTLTLEVDGALRQRGDSTLMLYPLQTILRQLAGFISLEDGDIIMTGTPAGVGPIKAGERFTGRIQAAGVDLVSASWEAR